MGFRRLADRRTIWGMRIRAGIIFVAGAAVGYLAGSAAGRERYDAIMSQLASLAEQVGIADLGARLGDRGTGLARTAADTAGDLVEVAADKATSAVEDLGNAKGTSTTKH